ncbi:TIR domain-containing protein [Cereibacter sphaeroides]|uniref:TIR domain-containing protein n=1 Tax=Cereibacter sphaeroides TaxID=1063 RepID=UPI001F162EB9|nr:TIR domain-containing protein [Cereibacter sphaeroides]MCE6950114.1 TIR domain-containing protein [Cereibacter sphaeroides]
MARRVFFSFHFANDHSRTQLVRNMNSLEGNSPVTPNRWEEIKKTGEAAIKKWINDNMTGKSCVVVLIGSETASRPWVRYEIKKAWEERKGVLGIHIHGLKDLNGNTSTKGVSPFADLMVSEHGKLVTLGSAPILKNPAGTTSKEIYGSIQSNIESWIEEAIQNRARYA